MRAPKSWWIVGAIVVLAAGLLPIAGYRLRRSQPGACALDGMIPSPALRVRVVDSQGAEFDFCTLTCAELWLKASNTAPAAIYVVDELTGKELEASRAHYARSQVIAHAPTRERRHVFAFESDARGHAKAFRGRVLTGRQRPFAEFADFGENTK
jgi:hypothetical protein